jgi:2-polyprenyl-3-methyl-5-hydroxy-6-metoxy-1,4-benzoquinol methylase
VLDVGCANGGLLTILYERGYKNLTGLDKSIFCVNHIKNINGIRAIHGGLFDLEFKEEAFSNEKFDVVILSHVLEHVLDIQLAFDFLERNCSKTGCCI